MEKTDANAGNEIIFELQDRIDEAIEYIEWQKDNATYDNIWREYEANKLIDILKGSDKE